MRCGLGGSIRCPDVVCAAGLPEPQVRGLSRRARRSRGGAARSGPVRGEVGHRVGPGARAAAGEGARPTNLLREEWPGTLSNFIFFGL